MLKRIILMFSLLALTSLITGCFHQRVIYDSDYNASKTVADHEALVFHIAGLINIGADLDLNQICPGGTGLVERRSFFDVSNMTLLGLGSFYVLGNGLTVQQVKVYCK